LLEDSASELARVSVYVNYNCLRIGDTYDCREKFFKTPFVGISPERKLEETFLQETHNAVNIFEHNARRGTEGI